MKILFSNSKDILFAFRYMRIRFRATNPGVWLFHCHTEPHLNRGMALMVHVS
jgi:FtsP/CotA-like multicopper oxidase with cupredoxin domain